jgi:uncharacterized protein YfcZ (UPF0381/DUF406 family)
VCRIKQIFDGHNVRFYFPDESKEESKVLLVYEPGTPNANQSLPEKAKHVADAEKELLKFARDAADVKSELVPVESKWHSFVAGKDGTTLNAYVECTSLSSGMLIFALFGCSESSAKIRPCRSRLVPRRVVTLRMSFSSEAQVPMLIVQLRRSFRSLRMQRRSKLIIAM